MRPLIVWNLGEGFHIYFGGPCRDEIDQTCAETLAAANTKAKSQSKDKNFISRRACWRRPAVRGARRSGQSTPLSPLQGRGSVALELCLVEVIGIAGLVAGCSVAVAWFAVQVLVLRDCADDDE